MGPPVRMFLAEEAIVESSRVNGGLNMMLKIGAAIKGDGEEDKQT